MIFRCNCYFGYLVNVCFEKSMVFDDHSLCREVDSSSDSQRSWEYVRILLERLQLAIYRIHEVIDFWDENPEEMKDTITN